MKKQSAVPLEKRLEQILTEMEMNNQQVKRLRKTKKKLFSKANPHTILFAAKLWGREIRLKIIV